MLSGKRMTNWMMRMMVRILKKYVANRYPEGVPAEDNIILNFCILKSAGQHTCSIIFWNSNPAELGEGRDPVYPIDYFKTIEIGD